MRWEEPARLCRIEQLLGQARICAGADCAFWSAGVESRQGHCSLDRLDLAGRLEFAAWLRELRRELDSPTAQDAARAAFYRRLNEGRSD